MLLIVSPKLLLSPVMMISSRDRISTACRTEGYFRGGRFEDPETVQNKECPAPPHPALREQSWPCLRCAPLPRAGGALHPGTRQDRLPPDG